jgi:hypothetical protein
LVAAALEVRQVITSALLETTASLRPSQLRPEAVAVGLDQEAHPMAEMAVAAAVLAVRQREPAERAASDSMAAHTGLAVTLRIAAAVAAACLRSVQSGTAGLVTVGLE